MTGAISNTTSWNPDPSDLTKRERAKIRANWDEFRRFTTPPGIPFDWGEWPLRSDLKHYASHHGFIKESPAGGRWETAEKLWMFLIRNAADDEDVGAAAVGQERLPTGGAASAGGSTRMLVDRRGGQRRSAHEHEQATLTGGDAGDVVKRNEVAVNRAKGEQEPSKHAKARGDDAQATLSESVGESGDWVAGPASRGTRLSRARVTRVYGGQVPLIIG